ncbi:hypothetical protein SCHPADRAFT_860666 [Schizopora paradoxa]|uniref:Pyridoxamine 5'-phosphate oxidase putative domain-containing protein n=1 Tax=Schizopora paradoxa TaxID=27342 RepID=A0A0H2R6S1_9AGAM|nr:hypothetical protein SCHPADRAFT_860666 [Schizopora paradoxa]
MGLSFDSIPDDKIEWIRKQEVFWVATAPLSGDGHVNVSPKGLRGTFYVEGPNEVWYEDLTGSGCETIAHLREPGNGRITILFNAMEGAAQIVRLYGKGTVHELGTPEYEAKIPPSKRMPGSRSVIVIKVHRVGTSCGWGVPYYKFEGHRRSLLTFNQNAEKKDNNFVPSEEPDGSKPVAGPRHGIRQMMWMRFNRSSIDSLPALSENGPCLSFLLPFSSAMPDTKEGGFRVREPGRVASSAQSQPEVVISKHQGNEKYYFFLGTIIGLIVPFVVRDIAEVFRRITNM